MVKDNLNNMKQTYSYNWILLLVSFLIFGEFSGLYAQIPIGAFREHLPFRSFFDVTVSPHTIYASTGNNIMMLDKKNLYEKSIISKIDGLSEIGIRHLQYLEHNDMLVIIYDNSNIDFLRGDKVVNMAEIKNKPIMGSKEIFSVHEEGNKLLLTTGFGIVIIDLERFLIVDTWFTHYNDRFCPVYDLTSYHDKYYIATQYGVFSIAKGNPHAPDFTVWNREVELGATSYNFIVTFGDYLVVNKPGDTHDQVWVYNGFEWNSNDEMSVEQMRDIKVRNNELAILDWSQIKFYNPDLSFKLLYKWNEGDLLPQARGFDFDGSELLWIADQYWGLVSYYREHTYPVFYTANGPASEMVEGMDCQAALVAVVPGSRRGWEFNYVAPSLSVFYNQQWNYITAPFNDYLHGHDLNNVVVNPDNNKEIYVASWTGGLFKVEDMKITQHWDYSNSPLVGYQVLAHDSTRYTTLSGLAFDKSGNLWITNSKVSTPLHVLKKDGTWRSYSLDPYIQGGSETVVEHILVDSRGYKWMTVPRQNKLIVFTDNNTIDNLSDDKVAQVDLNSAANIATSEIKCIVEDLNGNIWIGNDRTIKVVYNPSSVFNKPLTAKNILIDQKGYVQNLFEFETINAIAVDGANRKWVGTSQAGVFLLSESGTEQLLHFDQSNSPLLSDNIIDITIDHESGEVFFGTTAGIISYRGTAIAPKSNYDECIVYPNPVRENYQGSITITGLKIKSLCKIVDSSGNLIWQGYSLGGQLIWNGLDFYGRRPKTGVMYVFVSDDKGEDRQVAKFLMIQ